MLKAKPNIESRIRLLKREWSIVYDMLNGQNNSGFGWDEHRQLVVAEDAVWESYLKSHKEGAQFRFRTFPYYDQLTTIYARDRATGKDAQTAADVLEEIHADDVHTTDMNEERNTFYDCEADVSLDDMDVSGTNPRGDRDQGGSSSSNKRKKKSDARNNVFSSFNEAATLLGDKIQAVGEQISRSIASEVVVQQKSEEHQNMEERASNLYSALWSIKGLTDDQRFMLVDEQVAMFLHIISHHLKNRVIKHHFRRSGETVSRAFHSVLNAVICLQDVLFKKPEPITADSSDTRWKWFKNCLGALDGTHIKIRVPTVDKPRYRTRKGDIATNMLGVCTPEMQFVYVLPGWEGSVADGRVLRDAISRRHGLKVPHGKVYS
ncbi:hypothetical protein GOBAR_DD13516 [Gossypium barbadense]|nr:hypothetical protein GOBAR_DD13516 [Gossypium barbadense]